VVPYRKTVDCQGEKAMTRIKGILFTFLLSALAAPSWAQGTYTAASCNLSDVQAAINQELAHPVDGDIISIPAGTCTWTGTTAVSGTFTKSVTVQGAGAISATTGGASTTGSDSTVIIDNITGSGHSDIQLTTTSGKSLRFTGIAILQNSSSTGTFGAMVDFEGASTSVRVDHCHFYAFGSGNKDLKLGSNVLGVADHNYFDAAPGIVTNDFVFENGQKWNGATDPNGDGSWTDTDHFGTSQFFFVEDTLFNNGWVGDCSVGGRYVVRYSTMNNVFGTANHGLKPDSSRDRSCRAAEFYHNIFTASSGAQQGGAIYSNNGGTTLFWGNTSTWYRYMIQTDVVRKSNVPYTATPPPNGWGYCGTNFNGTGSAWDQNSNTATGYACMDSPARGAGDMVVGAFPSVVNQTTGTVAWPHQVRDPIYIFANTYNPAGYSPEGIFSDNSGMITDNRDYYQQFGTYGEPGSFNGTTGVGQGLLSARPSTCTAGPGGNTPGVGYWATNQNTLYVCNPTNTWTTYYTPYTYPHPLTAGGNAPQTTTTPPTNLVVNVQ
jgi:hypothetical protein